MGSAGQFGIGMLRCPQLTGRYSPLVSPILPLFLPIDARSIGLAQLFFGVSAFTLTARLVQFAPVFRMWNLSQSPFLVFAATRCRFLAAFPFYIIFAGIQRPPSSFGKSIVFFYYGMSKIVYS